VLVFLALSIPWPWVLVPVLLGLVHVVGISAMIGCVVERAGSGAGPVSVGSQSPTAAPSSPADRAVAEAIEADQQVTLGQLPGRVLRRLFKLSIVLGPEYFVVVWSG